MTLEFHVPRRFHPACSLLGRLIRWRVRDERRAEALYIVTLAVVVMGVLLVQYTAWAFLKTPILAAPRGTLAMTFWLAQVGSVLLVLLAGAFGFKPAVHVRCTPTALLVRQGIRTLHLAIEDIGEATLVPATTVHQHYRRYAATQVFASWYTPTMLLLTAPYGPVVLGLAEEDARRLLACLETTRTSVVATATPQDHLA